MNLAQLARASCMADTMRVPSSPPGNSNRYQPSAVTRAMLMTLSPSALKPPSANTLGLFEELGIVEHAHLGHGPAVYHLGRTHQHLVCEQCGTVIDVPVDALDALAHDLREGYGFQIRPGHFALTGRCAQHAISE